MRAELTGTTAALGFLLLACSQPAEPARSAAAQGPSGQASATLGDCAGGTGRSSLQSKCIETPMDSHEPEYQYAPPQTPPAGAGAPDPDWPAFATAGYVKPREAERGCVGRSLGMTRKLAERYPGSITMKFAVDRSGRPGPVVVLTDGLDGESTQAVGLAVQSCRWITGRDPWGRPATLWVILPVRLTLQ
jgi:hypothetical protein